MGVTLNNFKVLFFLFLILFFFGGCGSPILHSTSKDPSSSVRDQRTGNDPLSQPKIFTSAQLTASVSWVHRPSPKPDVENQLYILVTDAQGGLSDVPQDHELGFYAWMPSMGHGSADDGYIERESKGVYRIREFFVPHGGDWVFYVQLKKGEEVQSEVHFSTFIPLH